MTNQDFIHENIKSRLTTGSPAVIQLRIFCLPVS